MTFDKLIFISLLSFSLLAYAQEPEEIPEDVPPSGQAILPGEQDRPAPLNIGPPEQFGGAPVPVGIPAQTPPSAVGTPVATEAAPAATPAEEKKPEEEKIYLNVQDQDIKDVIKQISKATGRNFIIDAKVTGKVSILSNTMLTKEEAYQAFLSALEVAGFTVVQGPAGIIKIVSLRDAKNYPIPTHVDTTPFTDSYITRLIKLENINANDMAEAIKGLISRNGNLFAYGETNTMVLTDSGTNIDRLMKIIKELDQEGPQQVVEIIPLHFAAAKEMATILESLFEQQARAGGSRGGGGGSSGGEIAKVSKIIADERTNALIILASKRDLDKVKSLVNRLDAKLEEGAEGKVHVHYLKYAKAKDLAAVLQGLTGQAKGPGKGGEGVAVASLEEFSVTSDDATNSLIITSTPKTYSTLAEKVLNKLDIPRKQVYLEAMVIEFSLSRNKALGGSLHAGGGNKNLLGFGQTFKQLAGLFDPFSATNAGSPFLNAPGLLGGILSRRTVAIQVPDAAGVTKTVTVPAFSAFLTALDTFGDSNLIASPSLLALDNEEASIEIIRKEPEPGQTTISATGLQQLGKPERIEAGLRLKLTPQITELGTVRMKIDQQFSSFSTAKNTTLGTQAIVERKVATSVVTNDGQTVVIGGLMEDQVSITKTKIPILGDIPLLGWMFRKNETGKSKSNLLLFLTPHIIRDSSDFDKVLERKVGQQSAFMDKFYKKKKRDQIKGVIKEHHPTLMDYAHPEERFPLEAQSTAQPMDRAPMITARPDDEAHVTIILPPREESPKAEVKAQPVSQESGVTPVILPPSPPVVSGVESPKAIEQPVQKKKKTLPPPPPPPPPSAGHAPVVTLPPGTSTDLSE